jgi:hypothetical protein
MNVDELMASEQWNHQSQLVSELGHVLTRAQDDHGWLQVTINVGFVLGALIAGCESREVREALAEAIVERLMETARTGQMPGMVLQ